MPELAKAYVQIVPSAEGIKGQLGSVMDSEADNAGKSAGGKFGSAFGSVAKVGFAAAGAGIAAASAAVVKVAKDAVSGYANYEQLVGGLETMFEDLSYDVEQNANKAFKTAGLSANDYMETVMGFSAALNSSLTASEGNIARAADLSDQIIIDMADNANKMGSSMESIQNAYSGFAKQNYTMLDNLKLGYGGTKEEMERLLADASEIAGVEFDISSFADVAEAIHVVQTEMGITGTTALEASTTITGSMDSMKSAWENLITGLANPDADLGALIGNLVETAETAFGNLLPVVEQALTGIASFVEEIAPIIAEKLPGMVSAVLPPLLSAASSLVSALVSALPSLIQVLVDQGPMIINQLLATIMTTMPEIIAMGLTLITSLAQGIGDSLPELIPAAVEAIMTIATTLTDPGNIGQMIDAAIAIMIGLANGIIAALPELIAQAPVIIQNLVTAIVQNVPKLLSAAWEMITTLVSGLVEKLPEIGKSAGQIVETLVQGVADLASDIWSVGSDIVRGIWSGIEGAVSWFKEKVNGFFKGIVDGVKQSLGIASPSKVFAGIGENMAQGLGVGIEDGIDIVAKAVGDMSDAAINAWQADQLNTAIVGTGAYQLSSTAAGGVYDPLGGQASEIVNAVFAIGNMIVSAINDIDTEFTIDGDNLANAMYRYNQNAARRHGVAFVE